MKRLVRWFPWRIVRRDACRHMWTNWSDPEPATVTETVDFLGHAYTLAPRACTAQERRCLNCNLCERHRVGVGA